MILLNSEFCCLIASLIFISFDYEIINEFSHTKDVYESIGAKDVGIKIQILYEYYFALFCFISLELNLTN